MERGLRCAEHAIAQRTRHRHCRADGRTCHRRCAVSMAGGGSAAGVGGAVPGGAAPFTAAKSGLGYPMKVSNSSSLLARALSTIVEGSASPVRRHAWQARGEGQLSTRGKMRTDQLNQRGTGKLWAGPAPPNSSARGARKKQPEAACSCAPPKRKRMAPSVRSVRITEASAEPGVRNMPQRDCAHVLVLAVGRCVPQSPRRPRSSGRCAPGVRCQQTVGA